jgi:beta-glucosidase-like glycosyl hydrolase
VTEICLRFAIPILILMTSRYFKTLANSKHWSSYDVEKGHDNKPGGVVGGGAQYDRGSFNAHTSRQDMIETYWPQFRAAVQGARLGGTMCSYRLHVMTCGEWNPELAETDRTLLRTGIYSMMSRSRYNAVCVTGINGGSCVPSCANGAFNNQVLRDKLGFTGMIVSDCGAIHGIGTNHNYSQNVARAGLRGGCDVVSVSYLFIMYVHVRVCARECVTSPVQPSLMLSRVTGHFLSRVAVSRALILRQDCGSAYGASVPAALQDGSIDEADVDRALNRTLGQLISLGLANAKPPAPWGSLDERDIDTPAHRALAKAAAMQGFVLLKNEASVLPLKPLASNDGAVTERLKVAVIGPHFNSSTHLLANYYGDNDLVKTQTPLMGLQRRPELHVIGGVQGVPMCGTFCAPGDIPAAVTLASKADVAVLFVGLHSTQGAQSRANNISDDSPGQNNGPGMEREGFDRTVLTLPPGQEQLIKAVSAVVGLKVVVVLINSGGIACEAWLGEVPAVLEAYYPGALNKVTPAVLLPTSCACPPSHTAHFNGACR